MADPVAFPPSLSPMALFQTVYAELTDHARRLNNALPKDGTEGVREYTVTTLPDPTVSRGLIYVTNEAGGFTMAFSDGTNWRRVQDRAVVS